jgi:CHASE3 domain sensor protein
MKAGVSWKAWSTWKDDEQMLEPYTSEITGFDQHLDKLKNLTCDNATQQARLQTRGQQQNDWRSSFANKLVENPRAESAGSMQRVKT